jgi:hypothetical protein
MKVAALAAMLPFALGACATVVSGTKQKVSFDSNAKGAKVTLTSGETCNTPCKIKVKRKYDQRADFSHEGYQPTYVLLQSRLGGSTAGNLLLGGIIGGVVDGTNGASNHLSPNPVNVRMVPVGEMGDAQLLDKKGKVVGTVAANNDKVKLDVAKTIGAEAAGLKPAAAAAPAAAPAPAPEPVAVPTADAAAPAAPAAATPAEPPKD